MNCNKCGAVLDEQAMFCTQCGASQKKQTACHHCGSSIPVNAAFCDQCGKRNNPTPPPAENSFRSTGDVEKSPQTDDFIFLLSDKKASELASKADMPFCGYFGVLLKDGILSESVKQSDSSNQEAKTFIGRLLDRWKEWTKSVTVNRNAGSQVVENAKFYVVMDLADLPVVTYSFPSPVPGFPNASLKFDFWISSESLGLFIQRCAQGCISLTLQQFRQIAIEQLVKILPNYSLDRIAADPVSLEQISLDLAKISGIVSRVHFVKGKSGERRQFDVSEYKTAVYCESCGSSFSSPIKFCEKCGSEMNLSDWVGAAKHLISADGEQIILKVSFIELDEAPYFDDNRVFEDVIAILEPVFRKHSVAEIMSTSFLSEISIQLDAGLTPLWKGFATDISVIDIRTKSEDWFFNTEALIRDELRKVDTQTSFLKIEDAQLNLEEAAFAIAIRSLKQRNGQELAKRRAILENRRNEAEVEIEEHRQEIALRLEKENLEAQIDSERAARDRKIERAATQADREDELSQFGHDSSLEVRIAQHDIDLANLVADSQRQQRRKDADDDVYAKEAEIRLKAAEARELGSVDEDLQDRQSARQIEKLRAMAELEASMAKQDQDFELNKIASMGSMSPQQMLAMQAAQLAKSGGGGDASAEIVRSIAESQASVAGANLKDDLYNRMLEMQQKMSDAAIQAHREAAQIAQSTNEKSMESMAQVATAASSRGDNAVIEERKIPKCANPECDAIFKDKVPRFCNKCGYPQQ